MHPIQEGSEEAILAEQCSGNCTGDERFFATKDFFDKRFFVTKDFLVTERFLTKDFL